MGAIARESPRCLIRNRGHATAIRLAHCGCDLGDRVDLRTSDIGANPDQDQNQAHYRANRERVVNQNGRGEKAHDGNRHQNQVGRSRRDPSQDDLLRPNGERGAEGALIGHDGDQLGSPKAARSPAGRSSEFIVRTSKLPNRVVPPAVVVSEAVWHLIVRYLSYEA